MAIFNGTTGNDTIVGSIGSDTLNGNAGNDTLQGGDADDRIDGGAGIDTVSYSLANGGVEVSLEAGYGRGGSLPAGNATNVDEDLLLGIERVIGSKYADRLFGDAGANVLNGGAGHDSLFGNAGNDSLLGSAGSDFFDGSASASLSAGVGNDTIDGGTITDTNNYLDLNQVGYFGSGAAVTVNLATGLAKDGFGGTDTLRNINIVSGSAFGDTLTGSTRLIFESFTGAGGNDTIDGGAITDTRNAENGNRASYTWAQGGSVTVDLAAGTASGQGNDTLLHINQVRGSAVGDTLRGSNRTDVPETFEGMGGNDTLDGRGGLDVARYDYAKAGVTVSLATGVATVATGDRDALANIEGVRGSHFADVLSGGRAAADALEFFRGNGGNDTIDGGSGYDRVDYTTSMQAVKVQLGGSADGTATDGLPILAGDVAFAGTAGAVIGIDTLRRIEAVRGSDHADTLTGSGSASIAETFEGMAGNDTIDGGAGASDRASYFTSNAGVTVALGLGGAAGTAQDGFGGTDRLLRIERVQGTRDFADRITGNELGNLLDGVGGNDTLNGGAGNDTLTGGAGLDVFLFNTALSATTNVDRLSGFVSADDTIRLENAVFAKLTTTGALASTAFVLGTSALDAGDRIVYDSASGQIWYDSDGTGAAAKILFATVATGTSLSSTDFVIV